MEMKKIAFFTGFTFWTPSYERELELIQKHIDAGDNVEQIVCNGEMLSCYVNRNHTLKKCSRCIETRLYSYRLISKKIKRINYLHLTHKDKKIIKKYINLVDKLSDIQSLKKLKFDNYDLGLAVSSSVISLLRDDEPDIIKQKKLVARTLATSLSVYLSMINLLKKNKYSLVYLFNGRVAELRAVLRACQKMNVTCITHEIGCDKDHYSLYFNTIPHDIEYNTKVIIEHWNNSELEEQEKVNLASQFYINNSKGISKMGRSYVSGQTEGLLPSDWSSKNQNIVIFNSSEDEFASISNQWNYPFYENQEQGISWICRDLQRLRPDIKIYLRCHPNLTGLDNSQMKRIKNLSYDNLTVIPPDSPVSTYHLIQKAEKVITFGSTVGIEATFWRKPSICLGKSLYYELDATYNPSSHDEAISMIISYLPPKPIDGALKYGYYCQTFGYRYIHFKAEKVGKGKFKGVDLSQIKLVLCNLPFIKTRFLQNLFSLYTRFRIMSSFRKI